MNPFELIAKPLHELLFPRDYSYKNTTDLIEQRDEFVFYMVTECCKEGPIASQNYCPNCGKKIVHSEKV